MAEGRPAAEQNGGGAEHGGLWTAPGFLRAGRFVQAVRALFRPTGTADGKPGTGGGVRHGRGRTGDVRVERDGGGRGEYRALAHGDGEEFPAGVSRPFQRPDHVKGNPPAASLGTRPASTDERRDGRRGDRPLLQLGLAGLSVQWGTTAWRARLPAALREAGLAPAACRSFPPSLQAAGTAASTTESAGKSA